MVNFIIRFLREEDGPTAVEYAMMLALIAGAVLGGVSLVGSATAGMYENSGKELDTFLNKS